MPEPALTIASLIRDPRLQDACSRWLAGGRCELVWVDPASDPVEQLDRRREEFDAVLLEQGAIDPQSYQALSDLGLLLPAVVVGAVSGRIEFHDAEVHLPPDQLEQLSYSLDAAVSRFLRHGLVAASGSPAGQTPDTPDRWKLANRLKGRLGFVGVFYKRDPSRFLRNLPELESHELIHSLERTYRDLLLSYFRDPAAANQALESFVNTAFFSDLPITKTVEIHMNLIDGFSKQLKLEGHKNDFLQDYRLALLDVMAHLCEMYRRSIPPDAPLAGLPVEVSGQSSMA
ncbi:circadian clock protein KaiA [Cyanobium sp. Aljojuca 7D2]|uniref:circadian clock protein KaiA n=1 Tax=Cyanobium sp. Aljojuca 7D2 TaxID=2823698 RepID=UPI0020CF1BC5|nr:circadian clock protein KaiA [Cyanobium sp. Aljojuca 7D2]MCP9891273.1 circadian clock protein KaiA [Cyanobium sp. Aljojuca 7D2]